MKKTLLFAACAVFAAPAFATITAPDVIGQNSSLAEVFDSAQIQSEAGAPVDDSYSGRIKFTFTIEFTQFDGADADAEFSLFQLLTVAGNNEDFGVGKRWSELNWSIFRVNGVDGTDDGEPGSQSPLAVALNDPQTFTLVIDFVAGDDDIMTLDGGGFVHFQFIGDYSFESVVVRNGSGAQTSSFTDMTMEYLGPIDSDADGLPDVWEQRIIDAAAAENPPRHLTLADVKGPDDLPATSDYDGDAATDADEYLNKTDPLDPDTDDDGFYDGAETNTGIFVSYNPATNTGDTGTDPLDADTDDDGLADGVETNTGTYVSPTDTGTDPNEADSDGDEYSDELEVRLGSDPTDDTSTPPTGDQALVGADDFESYGDGPIAGKVGGDGFDFDNDTFDDIFVGHTKTYSDWDIVGGDPEVVNGRLVTKSGERILRQYNGPDLADETIGAFNVDSDSQVLYLRVDLTRSSNSAWSGMSSYDFSRERLFFGVPWPAGPSGQREFGIQISGGGPVAYTGIIPEIDKPYSIVAKIDYANNLLSLWINPDLAKTEAENTPDTTLAYTDGASSTAVRLGGGGVNTWDHLVVAREWSAINVFPSAGTDTDADGLPDVWEQQIIDAAAAEEPPRHLTLADVKGPNDAPDTSDYDGDASTDADEFSRSTNPTNPDTDGDGYYDSAETATGTFVSYDTTNNTGDTGSDPLNADTDDDGLADGVETATGTYVSPTDTGTDPNIRDWDGDEYPDGVELSTGSDPFDADSIPPTGDLATIGTDDFESYGDGPIDGKTGGTGFDFDNDSRSDIFVGHTQTYSNWDPVGGSPEVVGGKLSTMDTRTLRQYNGPGEGSTPGGDEYIGAVKGGSDGKVVYYRVDLTREDGASWSGMSSYDFGTERIFFGVPLPTGPSGQSEFGIQISVGDSVYSGIAPVPGKTYTLVAKLDFPADQLSLWVNPDLSKSEAENPPDATLEYTNSNWSTAVRLGSSGSAPTLWDHLVVAREWSALGVFPGVVPDDDFAAWIANFPEVGAQNGFGDDPDGDGLPNGIENVLGTNPATPNPGLRDVSAAPGAATFRHSLSNTVASDIATAYQWSTDLENWHASGESDANGTSIEITATTITDNDAPENDEIEVSASVTAGPASKLFLRIQAEQQKP